MDTNRKKVDLLTEEVKQLKKTIRYIKSIEKRFVTDGSDNKSIPMRIVGSNARDGVSIGIAFRSAASLFEIAEVTRHDIEQLIETTEIEIDELIK